MTIFLYKQVVVHFVNDSESEGNCNFDWQRGAKGDLEVCTNSCPATPLNCEGITIKAPACSGFWISTMTCKGERKSGHFLLVT